MVWGKFRLKKGGGGNVNIHEKSAGNKEQGRGIIIVYKNNVANKWGRNNVNSNEKNKGNKWGRHTMIIELRKINKKSGGGI